VPDLSAIHHPGCGKITSTNDAIGFVVAVRRYAVGVVLAARVTSVLPLDACAETASYPVDERIADRVVGYWTMTVREPPARIRIVGDGHR
jgi:hypothetical protein